MRNRIEVLYRRTKRKMMTGVDSNWCVYKPDGFHECVYYMDDVRKKATYMIRKENNNCILVELPDIPDFTTFTEEEFFQASLVWDYALDINIVLAIQKYNNNHFHNYSDASGYDKVHIYYD